MVSCAPEGVNQGPVLTGDEVRVIDGDSIEVGAEELRLLGINAPERTECYGPEATAALRALTEGPAISWMPEGSDQYGRTLAVVDAGLPSSVNVMMVEQGMAIAVTVDSQISDTLMQAEEGARRLGIGMWAPNACGEVMLPAIELAVDPLAEIVTIRADGVDVSGFILRDESSTNRFALPDRTIVTGELLVVTDCQTRPDAIAWCAANPVWNNQGDIVILQNSGGTVVTALRYGSKVGG
jgi:endonuclease YncB( thermonuclease family)